MSLAWLLSRPAVTSVIIGPETPEELRASATASEIRLDEAQLDQLTALADEPLAFHHRAGHGPGRPPRPSETPPATPPL